MKESIYDVAYYLYCYLKDKGIAFNKHGYPVLSCDHLIQEEPEEMLPYDHRNACLHPSKTVLCHFANDSRLYPRLRTLDSDLNEYRHFMGICGFDLSPRREYDISLQRFHLVINRMVDAFFAVNGIRILPNFRTGNINTIDSLSSYPARVYFTAGTLGCSKRHTKEADILLRAKILYARPKKLLIYGPLKRIYKETLEELGQDYMCFKDFRSASWGKRRSA